MSIHHFMIRGGVIRVLAALAGLAACLGFTAAAQASELFMATFEVSPTLAAPGVPRLVSMRFLAGCNRGASFVGQPDVRRRTVSVLLDVGDPRCDFFYQQTASVQITPDSEGDLRVVVMNSFGGYSGETVIHTRAAVSNRSTIDLTGMWYDPATFGSGVTFLHAGSGSDQVFGTWYVYDNAGNPRWYSIQSVQWHDGGTRATGTLYLTSGHCVSYPSPIVGCPVAAMSVLPSGTVTINVLGPNNAQITATALTGGASFTSSLIRSYF
jgi:hypothetical protein